MLGVLDEVEQVIQQGVGAQCGGQLVLGHEEVGNEFLGKMTLILGMIVKNSIPAVASSHNSVNDLPNYLLGFEMGQFVIRK